MDPAWIALFAFLGIALAFSFLCSVLEAVVLSITPSYIAAQHGRFAAQLTALKADIDRPLAAILTLNTFAHTIGAAGVGAAAQRIWGEASLTIVSAVATILILLISEIIPKTIGAVYWHALAHPVVAISRWLTALLLPVVWVCQLITRLVRRGETKSILSRTDVSRVAALGRRDGLVREFEHAIIDNLMHKAHLATRAVMTPEDRLIALPASQPVSTFAPGSQAWHVSRIPIYGRDVHEILGYVLKDEVLAERLAGRSGRTLADLGRPLLHIPAEASLADCFQRLVQGHEHIAVVRENGETVGVITMEDVIEELIGSEIVDESDRARGVLD